MALGSSVHAELGRRALWRLAAVSVASVALPSFAAKDCFLDCTQNCNRVAKGSFRYCESSCADYCLQDDREDGLSGSVNNNRGEVGLLSAYDLAAKVTGQAPAGVPFGEDRPPAFAMPSALSDALRSAVKAGDRDVEGIRRGNR